MRNLTCCKVIIALVAALIVFFIALFILNCTGKEMEYYTEDTSVMVIGNKDIVKNYTRKKSVKYACFADKTQKISDGQFLGCGELQVVRLPSDLETIGKYSFAGCDSLIAIDFPSGLQTIEEYAFLGCASLQSITIPPSVTTIGQYAFANCTGLKKITVENSTIKIEEHSFDKCPVEKIVLKNGVHSYLENYTSLGLSDSCKVITPDGTEKDMKTYVAEIKKNGNPEPEN